MKQFFIKNKKLTIEDWYLPAKLFGVLLGISFFILFYPNGRSGETVVFEIPKRSSFTSVSNILYEEGVIPNRLNFRIASFIYGAENKLKAGRYEIPARLNYFELIEYLLRGGHDEQMLVTIPEGIWQHNLAGLLQEKLDVDSTSFMQLSTNKYLLGKLGLESETIEGYLLPETYYFYTNSSAEEVIKKLFNEMNKAFDDSMKARLKVLEMTQHEILTMASIIEAESNILSEYKTISGVYHNRLKKGMMLEADPTIQYLKRHRKHNRIFYKDLEIDSPYNTYKYYGLPPTPINNPGFSAILAALYPEEHNYLFFVADGTGAHLFAETYREHLTNVEKYREWRSAQ